MGKKNTITLCEKKKKTNKLEKIWLLLRKGKKNG